MENDNGIIIAVMTLGMVSVMSSQFNCVKLFIIKQPTNNNALAVAYDGMVFASGEKNRQTKNNGYVGQIYS